MLLKNVNETIYFHSIFREHDNVTRLLSLLNLSRPGLAEVQNLKYQGNIVQAATALLQYYREKTNVWKVQQHMYDFIKSNATADAILNNTIRNLGGATDQRVMHYGPQGINWTHNPFWTTMHDAEWVWGLHRQPFWMTLAWKYNRTKNEVYAQTWARQFESWLDQCIRDNNYDYDLGARPKAENQFAPRKGLFPNPVNPHLSWSWRRLDAAKRAVNFPELMHHFIGSPHFSSRILVKFLNSVHEHGSVLASNPDQKFTRGNHGLYEAEGANTLGILYPEFFSAAQWRQNASSFLMHQMDQQVRQDGMHIEGIVTYQVATHRIFSEASLLASQNNMSSYPPWFKTRLDDMAVATQFLTLPNLDSVRFGDQGSRMNNTSAHRQHTALDNQKVDNMSGRLPFSGFYKLRGTSASPLQSTLILRCGPSMNAHSHKDTASFEYAVGDDIIISDAGAYTYRTIQDIFPRDTKRAYFQSTIAHNTLTLNKMDAHIPSLVHGPYRQYRGYDDCGVLAWAPHTQSTLLVVENRYILPYYFRVYRVVYLPVYLTSMNQF